MDSAFQLDSRDGAGPGRHMVYQAAPGQAPVLSGGRQIAKWRLFDKQKDIWAARVPTGLRTRQLYVNGVRAIRARGEEDPGGYVKSSNGFSRSAGDSDFQAGWKGLEVVSRSSWKEYRCPVDSVHAGEIKIKQPCWDLSQAHSGFTMDRISWFENAYGLLDENGEWYLDTAQNQLYYKPRSGENMASARVVAPVLESLFIARGTADRPLANLRIRGLTFAYATWMRPNTAEGFPDLQATYQYGDDGFGGDKIPSSVAFWFVDSLVLERNIFTGLGGNGPSLEAGCLNVRISGNRIYDISGNGLHIGNITANPGNPRERVAGNTIENNYVTQIGQEYHGACGIFVGYVSGTRILHNEISNVPYTGISLGWGWGRASIMSGNEIAYNHIHHHMATLKDGGGIYTLGAQPGTRIHHNYVHDQANDYGALYPDQGSSQMRWDSNVVKNVTRWFFMANGDTKGDTIVGNFSDTRAAIIIGEDSQVEGNLAISDGPWPDAASHIMASAGLEEPYREELLAANTVPGNPVSLGPEEKKGAIPMRSPAQPKSNGNLTRAIWNWIAPGRNRNLLGRAVRP